MQIFDIPIKNKNIVLALGAESAGNFSIFNKNKIYFSQDFGNLLEENNFKNFQKEILSFLQKEKLKPNVILTDLHPLMKTTLWGEKLSKKYKAHHIQVQHHHAHIFSAVAEQLSKNTIYKTQDTKKDKNSPVVTEQFYGDSPVVAEQLYGIALDGTGYGEDERIWGGECFAISNFQFQISACNAIASASRSNEVPNSNNKNPKQKMQIERIGHLENQTMIGGDLAIQEPARMLISILSKIPNNKLRVTNKLQNSKLKSQKEIIYSFIKKYYSKNEFEVLYNQLEQNFNCIETSSAGRILDAISLLLGFCTNKRNYKHEAIDLLEVNSTKPYANIKPKIIEVKNKDRLIENSSLKIDSKLKIQNSKLILNTTFLFEYLINNLHKDKKRLAATAQLYIAQGLYEIIQKHHASSKSVIPAYRQAGSQHAGISNKQGKPSIEIDNIILSGGLSYKKIISNYFQSKNISLNKKNDPVVAKQLYGVPRGDTGLSFGQIIYYLLNK